YFMPENTIAVVNRETIHDKYSKKSICWLDYVQKEGVAIQHALNGREKTIYVNGKPIRIDGWNEETGTVYQFHGCFWHGCPRCFDPDTINNKTQTTMRTLYSKTQKRSENIKQMYNLIEMWECDYKKLPERNINLEHEVITPLNPRDAFYGGRTNATKLIYKCRKPQK